MKPVLKYRGGKTREIKYFEKYIPKEFDTYIEPFVGGGAVFFHLEHDKNIINDINKKLITFYKQLKENYPELRQQLDCLQEVYENNQAEFEEQKMVVGGDFVENRNEELYYEMRDLFNYPNGRWLASTVYFFINKTAYSGMIRYNKKGEYNVPYGRYKNFNTKLITDEHHKLLTRTKVYNTDFEEIFKMAKPDDFMFLDPPYHKAVFNDYGNCVKSDENEFDEAEHRRLAEEFKKLKCKAMMVISETGLIRELYKDYIIDEYDKNYSVNIRNRFKNSAKHLVITNY
ncbi:MAG: DNA adenine methylase [Natronincolaceae bacterium]